jgi:hypothetical protein
MAARYPKDFIERHPDTRETYAPPTHRQEINTNVTFPPLVMAAFQELAGRYDVVEVECQEMAQIELKQGENGSDSGVSE